MENNHQLKNFVAFFPFSRPKGVDERWQTGRSPVCFLKIFSQLFRSPGASGGLAFKNKNLLMGISKAKIDTIVSIFAG